MVRSETAVTKSVDTAFRKQNPKVQLRFHALNVGYTFEAILIAPDAYKRAKAEKPQALAEAIRQTDIKTRMMIGGPIKFTAKGQVEGNFRRAFKIRDRDLFVVLPEAAAEARPEFPWREYKKV